MYEIVQYINDNIIWGVPLLAALALAGVYFSFKHGFIGFRPVMMFRELFRPGTPQVERPHSEYSGEYSVSPHITREVSVSSGENAVSAREVLSPFQTLTATLGVTLGTGNIIALGSGIALGGAGALFWMVVFGMFGAATAFAETRLGLRYKNPAVPGALAYIERGVGRVPAKIYAALCLIAAFGVGSATQLGVAAATLRNTFGTPREFTGLTIALAVALIMFGGSKFFGNFTEKIIPALALVYIGACVAIIVMNVRNLPAVFGDIITGAFSLRGGAGGVLGASFIWGIRRGVFSNEAGLGTAAFFTSQSNGATIQGALAVYIDTVIISLITGVAILVSGATSATGIGGEFYAGYAFASLPFGSGFLAVAIAVFALCTCAGWAVFGGQSAEYLFGHKTGHVYGALFVISAYAGAVTDAPLLLGIADMFNGAMAVPNLLALYALRRE